ncbi:MAG: AIR synthase-related protein [Chloroflexi bacterium]|nr:AIR synthase-related protein [Chloroflexota bacterium]
MAGQPRLDLDLEVRVQKVCREAVRQGWVTAAHDCSDGGLAVALAEACILGGVGLDASGIPQMGRADGLLFGERQSRIVVEVPQERVAEVIALAEREGVPAVLLGVTGGERLAVSGLVDLPVADLAGAWSGGLEYALTGR